MTLPQIDIDKAREIASTVPDKVATMVETAEKHPSVRKVVTVAGLVAASAAALTAAGIATYRHLRHEDCCTSGTCATGCSVSEPSCCDHCDCETPSAETDASPATETAEQDVEEVAEAPSETVSQAESEKPEATVEPEEPVVTKPSPAPRARKAPAKKTTAAKPKKATSEEPANDEPA